MKFKRRGKIVQWRKKKHLLFCGLFQSILSATYCERKEICINLIHFINEHKFSQLLYFFPLFFFPLFVMFIFRRCLFLFSFWFFFTHVGILVIYFNICEASEIVFSPASFYYFLLLFYFPLSFIFLSKYLKKSLLFFSFPSLFFLFVFSIFFLAFFL